MTVGKRTRVRTVDWRDAVWLEEADSWIRAHVPGTLIGPIEQPHVYPWATVLRVPTSDGVVWFKANAPIQRFEGALALSGDAGTRAGGVVAAGCDVALHCSGKMDEMVLVAAAVQPRPGASASTPSRCPRARLSTAQGSKRG